MATGTQMRTAWAPGIRNLAETLETHLAEVKHKGELKLWHSEPLARGSPLHATIHWKNRQATTSMPLTATEGLQDHQTLVPNLLRRCRQTGLDAKGATPELLKLKFYCSWALDFFFLFSFFLCSLSVCLSCHCLIFHHIYLLISLVLHFLLSFSFSFFSFFLGFLTFTIVI
jgi:hypothetical protein